jgi:hypothetical protein
VVMTKTIGKSQIIGSPAVKKTLIVCSNYSETVIITVLKYVFRIRLAKAGKDLGCSD